MIKLKYTVWNSKKTKLNKQKTKEHMKCSYMYVYTYDFQSGEWLVRVWRQTHVHVTNKNNNVSFEDLDIHYH
jgi:hypothetical protein